MTDLAHTDRPPTDTRRNARVSRINLVTNLAAGLTLFLLPIQYAEGGTQRVAIILGLFALVVAMRPVEALRTVLSWWPLLVLPAFYVATAAWSIYPYASARYGFQLLITIAMGIHYARLLGAQRLLTLTFITIFAFCIACVLNGTRGISEEGWVLIGLTGSKNQMAYAAQLLTVAALAVAVDPRQSMVLRLVTAPALLLAVGLVLGADSASGLVMMVVGALVFLAMALMQRFNRTGRIALFLGAIACCLPLASLIPEAQAFAHYIQVDVLNKDATLTGRTELWEIAGHLSRERPLVGWGYSSVWLDPGPIGETLRSHFGADTSGLTVNFHHTFIQAMVDGGYVATIITILLFAAITLAAFRRALLHPSIPFAFFVSMYISTFARAFTEVIVAQFNIYLFLIMAAGVYSLRGVTQRAAPAAVAPAVSTPKPIPSTPAARRALGRTMPSPARGPGDDLRDRMDEN